MAYSKRAPDIMRRLADRVRRDWPEYYRRCERNAGMLVGA
jgi:hypothetical protein